MTAYLPTAREIELERRIETWRTELRFAATPYARKRAMQMIDSLLGQRSPEMVAHLRQQGTR